MTVREFVKHIYQPGNVMLLIVDEREDMTFCAWASWLAVSETRGDRNVKWWKYEYGGFTVVLD